MPNKEMKEQQVMKSQKELDQKNIETIPRTLKFIYLALWKRNL